MSFEIPRRQYADLYGPTTGDTIRLADTELFLEIEKDLTVYGEEVVFGGGKVIRDGMGQNGQATRDEDVPDTVITNAVILDYTGIYKADVALRDGHIFKIGKAGNPQITDGVDIVIGASTEIIAGERKILTAGGMDTHIHFISPDQVPTALDQRRDHHDRRRHRPGRRHQGHHRDPRQMAHPADAAGRRRVAR